MGLFCSIKQEQEGECSADLLAMGIPTELKGSEELNIIYSYSVKFEVSGLSCAPDYRGVTEGNLPIGQSFVPILTHQLSVQKHAWALNLYELLLTTRF